MPTRSKLLLAALTSALVLAAVASTAAANRLVVNEAGFRITYSPLSFVPSFGSTVRCPVTLAGSFHERTISKTAGSLIGYITTVSVGTCEAGTVRVNAETLPWHIQYASFTGTLPNITAISDNLIRPSFEIQGEIFGLRVTCRYTTSSQAATDTRESRGVLTSQTPGSESTSSETSGCPSGRQSGTGSVKTSSGSSFTVTLGEGGGERPVRPSLSPSSVEFGRVEAESVTSRTITINAGTETPTINSIRVSVGTYFAVLDPNRCVGRTLAREGRCSFRVIFAAPAETGRSLEDRVIVDTSLETLVDVVRAST